VTEAADHESRRVKEFKALADEYRSTSPSDHCYFCKLPRGRPPLWTCPSHRYEEAHNLALVSAFLSRTEQPDPEDVRTFGSALSAWLINTNEGVAAKERLAREWPPSDPLLNIMSIGLLESQVEQVSTSGSLPDLDALALTAAERDELLRGVLDRDRAECTRQGGRFSLEAQELAGATYRMTGGPFGEDGQRVRLTVSKFGVAQFWEVAQGPPTTSDSTVTPEKNWYPDPTGRHEFRYWDGTKWTAHVSDRGTPATDALS
jgi:Protein of unknown function (DUF2510)